MVCAVLGAMRPLIYISTFLGYVPFTMNREGELRRTPFRLLWTGVVTSVYVTYAALRLVVFKVDTNAASSLGHVVECGIAFYSFIPLIAPLLLYSTVKFKDWQCFVRNLHQIDRHFLPNLCPENAERRCCVLKQTVFLVAFHSLEFVFAVWAWSSTYWFVYTWGVQQMLHSVLDQQILNAMLVVRDRRRRVNEDLLLLEGAPGGARPKQELYRLSGSRSLAWENDECRVEKLREAHLRLADAHEALNRIFGLPVLLEMAYVWAQTMMHVYYLLVKDSAFGGDGMVVTGVHVLNLATNRDVGGGRAAALDRFAKQLGAVRPELTACGLFDVDMPFLFTFFASMFGYLVILVQFDKSAESPLRNATTDGLV
ncbi:Uncharacterized protein GBIM_13639 [Gryllus bimaculatus]|nr:Uncharacterized protein GBIM_13639 [Gryllus bimaculatus]